MKDRISTTLENLSGLALLRSGTTAGMVSFLFGRPDGAPTDGETSLHVQCPWRIALNDRIVVASSDVFFPGDDREDIEEFDPDEETSLFETRIAEWFESGDPEDRIIEGVHADALGGFLMRLRGGATLEAFPAHSMHGTYSEYWRLLRPGARHFIVSGSGIEEV